jgi:Ala-tRNA(Pro) deacylase
MLTTPDSLYALLAELNLHYRRIDHPPVFTCAQADEVVPDLAVISTKNLLLRDRSGHFYLVMTACDTRLPLKSLAQALGIAERLSFASPQELQDVLGLSPGAVTIFALVNDTHHQVQLVIDAAIWPSETFLCHPMVNTATLVLPRADLLRFLEHTNHTVQVVDCF